MLPITINNKNPKNMTKYTNFNLERKRKKKKERTLINCRNNCTNSYPTNFNPMLQFGEEN